MRLFLAVFPPREVQQAVHAALGVARRPGDGVSWVKPDNLHFTLRFLGELGADGARRAGEAAVEAAAASRAFEVVLGAPGAFPNPRRARVIWLGLSRGGDELVRLAADLESALRRRGFDPADKPFAPHLTLGRVRANGADWSAALAAASVEPARFTVDRVGLIESTLSPKGSIYRSLVAAPLAD